nr:zinc finger protein jing homolog isoform X2 [Leptinotarsa decemlineata]XP_023013609.1 zinc finger protein jing homolog isoform X2 [Leptinotarsa decemlineata]
MPPTPTAHHPPWPWTADEAPSCKRVAPQDRAATHPKDTAFCKRPVEEPPVLCDRIELSEEPPCKRANIREKSVALKKKQTPICLSASKARPQHFVKIVPSSASPVNYLKVRKCEAAKLQQGKITEYFKSEVKSKGIKKDLFNFVKQAEMKRKVSLVDQQTQFNSLKMQNTRKEAKKTPSTRKGVQSKPKKLAPVTVPRKILPAPSNMSDKMSISEQLNNIAKFTPTVTLTALSFPPNYTYLHTKATKPPDAPIFVPQFATIANDKLPLPMINRTPCLNVIQPVQKIATINNFNCVKLNATVVPIVKVNTLPSRLNGSANLSNSATPPNLPNVIPNVALSLETAVPTVLSAKPKLNESNITPNLFLTPKHHSTPNGGETPLENVKNKCRTEESSRTEEPHRTEERQEIFRTDDPSPTPTDSDSGISSEVSNKECFELLEVSVSESVTVEQQKSPILSKPKTIRFPVKRNEKVDGKSTQHSADGQCRWAECSSRFETSGALLEHLQVKHVISQASQEHYVCLWLGCKVHGRTSCSRTWLERHVLAHAGTKPFRCIVEGCGQRFNSQLMLERHVNGHFNSDGSPNNNTAKKSPENGPCKLFKRNGKRIRFRRQPWSARMFDFIDAGVMEGLQHKLLILTQKRTLGKASDAGNTVHLKSQILARRVENDGSTKLLLRWHPTDVVPDEWVPEKEYKPTRIVSIPHLDPSSKNALKPSLFPSKQPPRQKHRRKPMSKQT